MAQEDIAQFWDRFASDRDVDAPYEAWAFGNDESDDPGQIRLADKLAVLVLEGPKRATTSLLSDYEEEGERLPEVGEYSVILDGTSNPVCIIRTSQIDTARFGDVDEEFAWTEGEGDRSLAYWRQAHLGFWARAGTTVTDDTMVVLERFEKVWPLD